MIRIPLISCLIAGALLAFEIEDVEFTQARDGTKRVTVTYTLTGDSADVGLYLSLDEGASYLRIKDGLTGDWGFDVAPGERSMSWSPTSLDSIVDEQVLIKVSGFKWAEGIRVPSGSFVFGDSSLENAAPEYAVELTNDFYLGRFPVTNQEFLEVLNWAWHNTEGLELSNGNAHLLGYGEQLLRLVNATIYSFDSDSFHYSGVYSGSFQGQPAHDHPVHSVSWYGAAMYCDWRSQMEGLPAFYNGDWLQSTTHNPYLTTGYRLPTEAEWEYASRYPDDRDYPWGGSIIGCVQLNHNDCIGGTSPFGFYAMYASYLGMQDLIGLLSEYCGDAYAPFHQENQTVDPIGADETTIRVAKGGCYVHSFPRNGFRIIRLPEDTSTCVGFRLCRTAH